MIRRLASLVALAGCQPQLALPPGAIIGCTTDQDCPDGLACVAALGRCVEPGSNAPPTATVGAVPRSVGDVRLPLTVVDAEGDTVTLTVEYLAGPDWEPATVTVPAIVPDADGVEVEVTWHAATDLPSDAYQSSLSLRVTPADATGVGQPVVVQSVAYGNTPPELLAVTMGSHVSGLAVVQIDVRDDEGDPVSIRDIELSRRGDFTDTLEVLLDAATIPAGAVSGLSTDPAAAVRHTFIWQSDLTAQVDESAARLRVVIIDEFDDTDEADSASFVLDNTTNPPAIALLAPPSGVISGLVAFDYELTDSDGDACLVTVQYSSDGESFTTASSPSQTAGLFPGLHTFEWQSSEVSASLSTTVPVLLRFSVTDVADVGEPVSTEVLSVDNRALSGNVAPSIVVGSIAPPGGGRYLTTVTVPYTVFDPNDDAVDVTIEYSVDYDPITGGGTWYTPSQGAGGDALTDLAASLEGEDHVFEWDAFADAQAGGKGLAVAVVDADGDGTAELSVVAPQGGIYLRMRAVDQATVPLTGNDATSPAIAIGNATPVALMTDMTGVQRGDVPIQFSFTDSLGDLAAVELWFRYNPYDDEDPYPSTPWRRAAIRLGATTALSTDGNAHVVIWDSEAPELPDRTAEQGIGARHLHHVQLQLRAVETPDAASIHRGAYVGLGHVIEIENQTPPRAEAYYVKTDGALRNGAIPIVYRLIDEQSELADVAIELSIDDGESWLPCTELAVPRSEGRTGLATAPTSAGGVLHTFIWESTRDLFRRTPATRVRLRATDAAGEGAPTLVMTPSEVGPPEAAVNPPFFHVTGPCAFSGGDSALAVGDFDRDGAMDFVVGNSSADQLRVVRGAGDGTFTLAGSAFAAGGLDPEAIAVGDFDGDLDADLAVTCRASDLVAVHRGNGNGTFAAPVTYVVGDEPVGITAADLDESGSLDLVVANYGDDSLTVLAGNGDGTFLATSGSPYDRGAGHEVLAVGVVDCDLDGVLDVLSVGEAGYMVVTRGNGGTAWDGTLGPLMLTDVNSSSGGRRGLAIADFSGDGVPDVAVNTPSKLVPLRGYGNCGFAQMPAIPINHGRGVVAGDFSGDGVADIVASAWGDSDAKLYVSTTPPDRYSVGLTFAGSYPTNYSEALAAADFDGDGALDFLAHGTCGQEIYLSGGAPRASEETFGAVRIFTGDGPLYHAGVADLNSDGVLDLLYTGNARPEVRWGRSIEGLGEGIFDPPVTVGSIYSAGDVATGDFDGDGAVDVAVLRDSWDRVEIFAGAVDPTFWDFTTSVDVGDAPEELIVRDLDGDGLADLATCNVLSDDLSIALATGPGAFAAATSRGLGDMCVSFTSGDFDGDTDIDLAVVVDKPPSFPEAQDLLILRNAGDGTFASSLGPIAVGGSSSVRAADLTNDGILDLLVVSGYPDSAGSRITPFIGQASSPGIGNGAFVAAAPIPIYRPGNVTIGEWNGDGVLDFVVGEINTSTLRLYFGIGSGGRGTGAFAAPVASQVAETMHYGVVSDFNADGILDLAMTSDSDEVGLQLGRRENPRETWLLQPSSANVVGAVVPTEDDLFGDPPLTVLSQRRFRGLIDAAPGDGRRGADGIAEDFRTMVKHSGLPAPATGGLVPITHAYVAGGDLRLARVIDADGNRRLEVQARLGPAVAPGPPAEPRRQGLELDVAAASQLGVIIDLPVLPAIPTSDFDNEPVIVYLRVTDWLRADAMAGDPLYSGATPPGSSPYLPIATGAGTQRDVIRERYTYVPVLQSPGNSFASGTGTRFVVDPSGRRIRVLCERLGVLQAYRY